jgi:hypothetical protein
LLTRGALCALDIGPEGWTWVYLTPNHTFTHENGKELTSDERKNIKCKDPDKRETVTGLELLDNGWLGALGGNFAWYANVLAMVALVFALVRKPRPAAWISFAGLVLGLDAYLFDSTPTIDMPGQSVDYLGSGYYVWEGSMAVLLLAQIIALRTRRMLPPEIVMKA